MTKSKHKKADHQVGFFVFLRLTDIWLAVR